MARRKMKKNSRSKKQPLSITGVAESLILANAGTKALFGTTLPKFALEGWATPITPTTGGGYGSGNSYGFSAAELIKGTLGIGDGFGQASTYPFSGGSNTWEGVSVAIKQNLRANGVSSLMTVILVPVGFRLGKKLMNRPIRSGNKLLKMAGIGKEVKI